MKNIKTILDLIKEYLRNNNIKMDNTILLAVEKRKNGKVFSFNEHISGMFYALISGGTKWNVILKNKKYIDETFFYFDKNKLLNQFKTNSQYFYDRFEHNKCGIRFLDKCLRALYYNIGVFERIEALYGTLDNYIEQKSPYEILKDLSSGNLKLFGMKRTLVAEYLRNVGVDFAKPDSHLSHILGKDCLNYIKNDNPTEIIKLVEKISHITNYSQVEIDSLLWHFCADNYGEVCTSNPKCNICPINKYCNKRKNITPSENPHKKVFIKKHKDYTSTKNTSVSKGHRDSDIENAYRKVLDKLTIGHIYQCSDIESLVNSVYHNKSSILPSDYCYNRINKNLVVDFERRMHVFYYLKKDSYKYIGENASFTGDIIHKHICVGRWENGEIMYLDKDKVLHNNKND